MGAKVLGLRGPPAGPFFFLIVFTESFLTLVDADQDPQKEGLERQGPALGGKNTLIELTVTNVLHKLKVFRSTFQINFKKCICP